MVRALPTSEHHTAHNRRHSAPAQSRDDARTTRRSPPAASTGSRRGREIRRRRVFTRQWLLRAVSQPPRRRRCPNPTAPPGPAIGGASPVVVAGTGPAALVAVASFAAVYSPQPLNCAHKTRSCGVKYDAELFRRNLRLLVGVLRRPCTRCRHTLDTESVPGFRRCRVETWPSEPVSRVEVGPGSRAGTAAVRGTG